MIVVGNVPCYACSLARSLVRTAVPDKQAAKQAGVEEARFDGPSRPSYYTPSSLQGPAPAIKGEFGEMLAWTAIEMAAPPLDDLCSSVVAKSRSSSRAVQLSLSLCTDKAGAFNSGLVGMVFCFSPSSHAAHLPPSRTHSSSPFVHVDCSSIHSLLRHTMLSPRTLTPQEIVQLIAQGDSIVILHNDVLRLNGWKEKHPGGRLVIEHMVGRDASTEISM